MGRKRYGIATDGVPFSIELPHELSLQCCSCGLVHLIKLKLKADMLEINMRQLAAETKRVRKRENVRRGIRKLKA